MNERQKQNKNLVQGPHQTDPPYIKKQMIRQSRNRAAHQRKLKATQTQTVMRRTCPRVAAPRAQALEQKTVVAKYRGEEWMAESCKSCDRRTADFGACRR
ncbi:MAG: hypothetical protein WA581_21610 [Candidatus Acidiferrales bacterium]